MTRDELIQHIKSKDKSKRDISKIDLEGVRTNLLHVQKNQILFRPGEEANSIFFVIEGEVILTRKEEIKTIEEKNYFGLDAIQADTKRIYKAISIKPGIILEIFLHEKPKKITETKLENLGAKSNKSYGLKSDASKSISQLPFKSTESFTNEFVNGVLIVSVNLKKAVLSHSKPFLNHMINSIKNESRNIVVDLSNCSIIDSTFLGVLVKSHKSIIDQNGEIVLIYDQEHSSTLFMITYMDKVFKIFNNREDAVNHFASKH
ncbi:MAG: cyclic nucleotide-binding domain-containing protein [Melioribacteraceae bacterium]|nr:cyclic nucleotide-binding domain-containing protein [Melioribacteraceae bacterium]